MKLALFDLDGTLFDTRDVNFYAYRDALLNVGFKLDYEYYTKECNGRHYKEFLPTITNNAGQDIYEVVHNLKKDLYKGHLDKVRINEKLFDIIIALKASGYTIAIVTTASRQNCNDILTYTEKKDLFDLVVTANDYERTKPFPDSFELAMKKYNSSPNQTLIFEDSNVGIEAAIRTGATVFKVEKF